MFRTSVSRLVQPFGSLIIKNGYATIRGPRKSTKKVQVIKEDYYILQKEQDKIQRLSDKAEKLKKEIAEMKLKLKESKQKKPPTL